MADSRSDLTGTTPTSDGRPDRPGAVPDHQTDLLSETALKGHIRSLLDQLGNTAEEVAASLHRAGVRGNRSDATGCPVASYLHAVTAADPQVRRLGVTTRRVVIMQRPHWWSRHTRVPLPAAVRGFVRRFDVGEFTQLVSQAATTPAVR